MTSNDDNEDNKINTNELLFKVTEIEKVSQKYYDSMNELNEKNIKLNQYKSMIKYLFENQTFKDSSMYCLIPGNIFNFMERKQCVEYVQNIIKGLINDINQIKQKINNNKKEIIDTLTNANDIIYLDREIADELSKELIKKFKKDSNKNKNKIKEYEDEDSNENEEEED